MRYKNQNFTIEANRECYCSPTTGSVQGITNMQQQEQVQLPASAANRMKWPFQCLAEILTAWCYIRISESWMATCFLMYPCLYTGSQLIIQIPFILFIFPFFLYFLYSIQYIAPNTQQLDYVYGTHINILPLFIKGLDPLWNTTYTPQSIMHHIKGK